MTTTEGKKPRKSERRGGDRREAAQPIAVPDRRAGERRTGSDRRSKRG